VVAKLFHIVEPDVAVFGDTGFSAADHHPAHGRGPVACRSRSSAAPTGAIPTASAMSSRNQYLTADERALAPKILRHVQAARTACVPGTWTSASIEHSGLQALERRRFSPGTTSALRQAAGLGTPAPAAL